MNTDLTAQGDLLAARLQREADPLVGALLSATDKGRFVELEEGHPQCRGPEDRTLGPGERFEDPLIGSGNRAQSLSAHPEQELFEALCRGVGANPHQRW